jgi:cytochrome c
MLSLASSSAPSRGRTLRALPLMALPILLMVGPMQPEAHAQSQPVQSVQQAQQAQGQDALQILLQRNNCTACHLIDKRKYGPTMKEVALRYAKDPAAAQKLAKKIKEGGAGVWGEDIMPPQPLVRDPDLKAMVELILALKP